jgi:uncharacterized protein YecT (DUF1311 family)
MKLFITVLALSLSVLATAQADTFKQDTAAIENKLETEMTKDPSTLGVNTATDNARKLYDLLLNKYYKLCLSKLSTTHKSKLVAAQKAWLSFRDKEIELIGVSMDEKYTGGGSMWSNIATIKVYELTKKRALDLYDHWQILQGLM